jgi:hypothetical protein
LLETDSNEIRLSFAEQQRTDGRTMLFLSANSTPCTEGVLNEC